MKRNWLKSPYKVFVVSCLIFCSLAMQWQPKDSQSIEVSKYKMTLSEYEFFKGDLSRLEPTDRVVPYTLNTPLFTDYAQKLRFIYFPVGEKAQYNPEQVFSFPEGTAIIKNFYYHIDERKPEKGRNLIETRVLLKEATGWKALPYVWNAEQTEAYLEVTGARKDIQWKDAKGKKQQVEYVVPNMIQCKECHSRDKTLVPIGPSARQLNRSFEFTSGSANQLDYLATNGYLTGLPTVELRPKSAQWDQPQMDDLESRARAYLDANCGHCHNPKGPANTSGMFLDSHTSNPAQLGVNKVPIAAGKGSGGRDYGIVPGNANASILVHRMESLDPGVMMPELGRKRRHEEGIQLIKDWINAMDE